MNQLYVMRLMGSHYRCLLCGTLALLLCSVNVFSEDDGGNQSDYVELKTVIVTGVRQEDQNSIPKNITVIRSEDIERSTATQLVELLSQEANVTMRTFTGNDKYGGIDIRGMGDASDSNVLVMVDGLRLNNDDLSGPDLSSIPLSQIERIEVIRSGGTVRYGNGAVGGVVNIVTKNRPTNMDMYVASGSYATQDIRFNYANSEHDALAVKTNMSYYKTDGYRDNGGLEKKDFLIDLESVFSDELLMGLTAKVHQDNFGLPGPVSKENYEGSADQRKSTTDPKDGGDSNENLLRWKMAYTPTENQTADASVYYREHYSDTVIKYAPTTPKRDQLLSIEDRRVGGDLIYSRSDSFYGMTNKTSIGTDFFVTDYEQYRNGRTVPDQSEQKMGNIDGQALFTDWGLDGKRWSFSAGWREDRSQLSQNEENFKHLCDYTNVIIPPFPFPIPVQSNCRNEWVNKVSRDEVWKNSAAEAGVVYRFNDVFNGFIGFAKSFRNPNLDELLLSESDLLPQTGKHWDMGVRFNNNRAKWELTVFSIVIEDEILYGMDPVTSLSVNRNAVELTRRTGAETDFSYGFMDNRLRLNANMGYVEAHFDESGAFVPLVPRVTSTVGLIWNPNKSLSYSVSAHYTGERYDGNDFNNKTYDKLDAYTTVDAKVSWTINSVEVFVSAANILNEVYSTSGYSGTFYPMPERNFMTGFKYRF